MTTIAPILSVLLLTAWPATFALTAQSRSRPLDAAGLEDRERLLRPYFHLVDAYRNRDLSARDRIKIWTVADLQRTLSLLRSIKGNINDRGVPARDWKPAVVRAAVLLHLEAVDETLPTSSAPHRTMALGLLELMELPEDREFKQRTLALMTKQLRAVARLDEALMIANAGLEQLPDDPVLLTLAGTLHEELARLATTGGTRTDEDDHLTSAERMLRKVLAVDPSRDEARLRLGRVLHLRGRRSEAVSELMPIVHSHDPHWQHLAHLFLGAIHESESRFDEAETSYRAALAVNLHGQSAELALSALLDRRGKRTESRESARSALRKAPRPIVDSWWLYFFGPGETDVASEFLSLRKEVLR